MKQKNIDFLRQEVIDYGLRIEDLFSPKAQKEFYERYKQDLRKQKAITASQNNLVIEDGIAYYEGEAIGITIANGLRTFIVSKNLIKIRKTVTKLNTIACLPSPPVAGLDWQKITQKEKNALTRDVFCKTGNDVNDRLISIDGTEITQDELSSNGEHEARYIAYI